VTSTVAETMNQEQNVCWKGEKKKFGTWKHSEGIILRSDFNKSTHYGLDGPQIDSRWRRDCSSPSRQALGPTQPGVQWVPGPFQGVKRPERGVYHPHSTSAEVKE